MANHIDDYVKRPIRYRNVDGLEELGAGIVLTLLPLLTFVHESAPSSSIWQYRATFYICIAAVGFIALYCPKVLKKRITFPRTGYVRQRPDRTRVTIAVLVAVAVATAIALALHRVAPHFSETVKVLFLSVGWGLIYALGTRMDAAWRWIFLVAMVVGPPAVATLPLGQLWSGNLPFVLQGLILVISGAIALALYLRQNPIPEQGAE